MVLNRELHPCVRLRALQTYLFLDKAEVLCINSPTIDMRESGQQMAILGGCKNFRALSVPRSVVHWLIHRFPVNLAPNGPFRRGAAHLGMHVTGCRFILCSTAALGSPSALSPLQANWQFGYSGLYSVLLEKEGGGQVPEENVFLLSGF